VRAGAPGTPLGGGTASYANPCVPLVAGISVADGRPAGGGSVAVDVVLVAVLVTVDDELDVVVVVVCVGGGQKNPTHVAAPALAVHSSSAANPAPSATPNVLVTFVSRCIMSPP